MDRKMDVPENSKTAWWRQHKNDPRIIECMREARRKYYYKNRESEKARALAYYYAKKALANPPVLPAPIPGPEILPADPEILPVASSPAGGQPAP
jgi:hypothetical protein